MLPFPWILCNHLQNAVATTYIFGLQLSTFLFYNKHIYDLKDNPIFEVEIYTKEKNKENVFLISQNNVSNYELIKNDKVFDIHIFI